MKVFEEVMGFVEAVIDDPTDRGLATALERHAGARLALVDYLEARLVHLEAPVSESEDSDEWWALLTLLASTWGEAECQAFRERVGLRAALPSAYAVLASIVRAAFSADDAEQWLIAALEGPDMHTRYAASHLAYQLFEDDPLYRPSAAGRARMRAADPLAG